ncbi:MAG: acyl-CoA dehydrogenase family protein [Dehalococcoidia bacterium]|nr:acyl-CoA dehydrogenase family protein [Dehalococcoidia bacterium]
MDFSLSEEHQMFQTMVRDFATKEIEPHAARIDEEEEFPIDNVRKMGEMGLFGLTIDEKYGGSGGDAIQLAIATEEIARACAATSTIYLASLSLGAHPIYNHGNEEQKMRFMPPLAGGQKLAAFALTENLAGSDAAALQTVAERTDNGYLLSGNKIFITNGAEADTIVVFATADRSLAHKGVTGFIVEKEAPGFSVAKKERKLGIRGSSTAELVFDNCFVPANQVLEEEGKGFRAAMEAIDASRVSVASQAVGIARACMEASLRYAKERKQFGQPIVEFQALQWMLADMATGIDAARLLTLRAAYLKEHRKPYLKEVAMAKVFASEVAMQSAIKAVQIHGGYGYIKEYPVERFMRDAKITEIYEGTSEMQRMTIIRQLLRES